MVYLIYTGSKTELKGRWNGLICYTSITELKIGRMASLVYTSTAELKARQNGLFSLYW